MPKEYKPLEADPDFEQWWKFYPRKASKGDARKAWEQTKPIRPDLPRLIKAVVVQRANPDWQKDDGRYVPYPATWLRDERWEDSPDVEIERVKDGKAWHETVSGIEARAQELGIAWDPRIENFMQFKLRVMDAAKNVIPIARQA